MSETDDRKQQLESNKLNKRLRRHVGQAIADFNMIEEGDKIMVCLSGGKDSYAMLSLLMALQKTAPVKFELVAVNMDQKQPGYPEHILPNYLDALGVPYYIVEKDTYSIVKSVIPEGKTTCGLCSRLRRGTLYGFAEEIGATKIALGHHKDDIVETLFLNLFYGGKLKAMPPKLLADDQRNIIIRPMAYCREGDIEKFAKIMQYPIIPCNLCGSQENLQRQNIKSMLVEWDNKFPGRTETIFGALTRVTPSHLADTALFDFINLSIDRTQNKDESKSSQVQNKNVISGNSEALFDKVDFEELANSEIARPEIQDNSQDHTQNSAQDKSNSDVRLWVEEDQIKTVNL
jgi:tRNA 2-thiocytidine biosynthesis protein TtcA